VQVRAPRGCGATHTRTAAPPRGSPYGSS